MRHKGIEIRDNMNPNLPILTVGFSKHCSVGCGVLSML